MAGAVLHEPDAHLGGGGLGVRERLISRSSISQRPEGWTVFAASRGSGSGGASSAAGTCDNRPSCCTRHPRAAGCSRHCRGASSSGTADLSAGTLTLRDDLFLVDHTSTAGAHRPPAVVRSYEACDGASASAQIRAVSNATRSARAQLATAPLPIVAIIFFGTHYERLPLLRLYERYFAQTVYMSPRAEIHSSLRRAAGRGAVGAVGAGSAPWPSAPRALSYHCAHGLKATYACVADIARRALAAPPPPGHPRAAHGGVQRGGGVGDGGGSVGGGGGVLYFHFDLWIQPWRLRPAASLGSVWRLLWALPAGRIHIKQGGPTRLLPL